MKKNVTAKTAEQEIYARRIAELSKSESNLIQANKHLAEANLILSRTMGQLIEMYKDATTKKQEDQTVLPLVGPKVRELITFFDTKN